MELFICECGWRYILGKKKFFGPLFENSYECAQIRPIEDFHDGYGHCWIYWTHTRRPEAGASRSDNHQDSSQ